MKQVARPTNPTVDEELAAAIAAAWHAVAARHVEPRSIVGLKQKKSGVFALPGALRDGRAVIAKRGSHVALASELAYYRDIAPRLPVRTLQLHGWLLDEATLYLFIESAGSDRYQGSSAERAALTDWLVAVHTATASMSGDAIPPLTPGRYLDHLHRARAALEVGLRNQVLDSADRATLLGVDDLLARVEGCWPSIEDCLARAPHVLVHGDLVAKNIHVLQGVEGPLILPLDWETSGWGVPATDLSTGGNGKVSTNPDLRAYAERVRGLYPGWDHGAVQRLSAVGSLFRSLASMDWVSRRLAYEWVERPMRDLPAFAEALQASISGAGVGGAW